ncbi:PH domain-containing protein [Pedobacter chinensis]|uniref:PH domain-containing protein n=1 Tax=Pedobacter chinensis TaxID=2282421 RepID=A0A369Q451_9SPHI|nr:PH domain-containing protein [Pedobacter chinensis]RDC58255.1 PH domain-containing protein [Pedobacter chinensis]
MSAEIFTNEAIDLESLPKYEEIHLNKPHSDYWKIICINLFILFLLIGIGGGLLIVFNQKVRPHVILIATVYVALMVIFFLLFWASFKKRGYAIRTKDVIYKSGIIAESTTIVPLNRIQHIELNEGMLSRIYKLGSLQIFTAGGQTGHLRIAGIPIAEAKSIRDLLLNKLDLIENPETENEI